MPNILLDQVTPTTGAQAEVGAEINKKKLNVLGQKYTTRILFVNKVFFWIIILITPEMNIIDYQFNLTSLLLFFNRKMQKE